MSTLPRLAAEAVPPGRLPIAEPFPYDAVSGLGTSDPYIDMIAGAASRSAQEASSRETQAHAQGVRDGRLEAQKMFDAQLGRERSGVAAALAQFTRDRAAYFGKVEGEVVELALSIAGKILHREAQLDPLLLAGIVRVALERIEGASGVVLHVHPQNANDWRRYLAVELDPADLPQILEDPAQTPDTCVLETAMGTTTLGLEVQLKEIERGLMDLLSARPGTGV